MRVAVLGAGTMGAGIAQLALQHGHTATLFDVAEPALARGRGSIEAGLAKLVEKGRLEAAARDAALGRLSLVTELAALADMDLVIEAVPEQLALKQGLFKQLDGLCRADAVLASNTSSLSITAIAAATRHPERVIGLHFFNPAPLMALVEVVQAHQSGPAAVAAAKAFAEGLGKTAVVCQDTPGFIVNRVARPFYGEALKVLGEGGASIEAIDASLKAAGFRMGPFELMDLIGIDVNFAVTQSVYQAFFGEPRFRPHPIQQRMVHAGTYGRKSGAGFYPYGEDAAPRPTPFLALPAASPGRVVVVGTPPDLPVWAETLSHQGHTLVVVDASNGLLPGDLLADLDDADGVYEVAGLPPTQRHALQHQIVGRLHRGAWLVTNDVTRTATAAAADLGCPLAVVGDWAGGHGPWEVALPAGLEHDAALLRALAGLDVPLLHVTDHPGGVAARVIALLANEAAFALQEGVASAMDIDQAMRLGVNYPRGPLEWADRLGAARIVALLDALRAQLGEERYRVAPLLRRHAVANQPLR